MAMTLAANGGLDDLTKQFDALVRQDREKLSAFLKDQGDPHNIDPLTVPAEIWGNTAWDYMSPMDRNSILGGMMRHTLGRAREVMPIYAESEGYKSVGASEFRSMSDLLLVPLLVKDGKHGFRFRVLNDPDLLKPTDVKSSTLVLYLSGGTGINDQTVHKSTPTLVTEYDLQLESAALGARCFIPGSFNRGTRLMNFYNLAHKGGEEIKRAAEFIGVEGIMLRRPEDTAEHCLTYMQKYKVNTLAAVPAPPPAVKHGPMDKGAPKGGGVSFEELYYRDANVIKEQISTAFVTGFALPKDVIGLAEKHDINLFTTWGASEAIPGATSTVLGPATRTCKYNSQHLLWGPHYLSVIDTSGGGPRLCKPGEDGLLSLTTIARQGTMFINYLIGDKAKVVSYDCSCGRTTPVIGNIRREDDPAALAAGGCRYT